MTPDLDPRFFSTPTDLRAWLEEHHEVRDELWVGLWKKATGRPSITWPELVDELLAFGWIDGIRKSIDQESYAIRITPRRSGSIWSVVNVRRAKELIELGRMRPPGLAAFEARDEEKTARYSYERKAESLGEYEAELRANEKAWAFFSSQPPGYRKMATAWVVSAKREDTRRRRLETLIRDSERGLRIGPLRR